MPKPKINKKKCNNCGICIDVCPVGVFGKKGKEIMVIKAKDCTGCRACESQCPVNAIEVED